jgi:hypothetical protein
VENWWSPYGVSGRVSAAVLLLVVAGFVAAQGKLGGALVAVVFAAISFASAWRYSRTHPSDRP